MLKKEVPKLKKDIAKKVLQNIVYGKKGYMLNVEGLIVQIAYNIRYTHSKKIVLSIKEDLCKIVSWGN